MKRPFISFGLLITFLFLHSCAKNPVTGKRDFMLMSEGQEIAMGQQSDPDIVRSLGLYENAAMQKFIGEKGQQMVGISYRPNLKYEFKIVDSPVVNAFAVPGGYVYFTRGIMAHFNNEAEFAGVLGHEIGHISARHSAKQYSNSMLAQFGLVAGMMVFPNLAQFSDLAQNGLGLLFLKFGRDAESQADKLGVEYSTKINYDAQQMADFFGTLDRLGKQSGSDQIPTFLSTHPNPLDREKKVEKLAAEWKQKEGTTDLKINRDSYLKMIDGLVYGDDPKQGFAENNTFYHPVLKFQFTVPSQWTLQNTPEQVQAAPKDGNAMVMLTLAPGSSLEEAAQSFISKYQLQVAQSQQNTVNGLPALAVIADQKQQSTQQGQGQTVRTLIYFIQHEGNIYAILGMSAMNTFNQYFELFQSTARSFAVLTDPSKLNKKAERIKIQTVNQNTTLREAFRQFGVDEKRMDELAIVNGMKLGDKVERNTLIKVLQ
jgi:predicted Zn-dependent protease